MKQFLSVIIVILTVVYASAIAEPSSGAVEKIEWEKIRSLWLEVKQDPCQKNLIEFYESLPDFDLTEQEQDNLETDVPKLLQSDFQIITNQLNQDSVVAFQIALRYLHFAHAGFWYRIQDTLSGSIADRPLIFLEAAKETRSEFVKASDDPVALVGFIGSTTDTSEAGCHKIYNQRRKALQKIQEPNLLGIRDECIDMLDRSLKPMDMSEVPTVTKRVKVDLSFLEGEKIQRFMYLAEVYVTATGAIKEIKIIKGGDPEIEAAFIDSLHLWEFEPAMKNGNPIESKLTVSLWPSF